MATYSPQKIEVSINGKSMSGFADGTFVNVVKTSDAFTMSTGADGNTARIHSADSSGTITLTLQQTSASNDYLSQLALIDETTQQAVFMIQVKDAMGTSLWIANQAWIRKLPDSEFSNDMATREWNIDCASLISNVGGNNAFPSGVVPVP